MKKARTRTETKAIIELSEKDLVAVAGGRRIVVETRKPKGK